jgi:integrase
MNALRLFCPDASEADPGPPATEGTVRQVITSYLKHIKARVGVSDYSTHAYDNARRDLTRFADWSRDGVSHGDTTLDRCRRNDLTDFLLANPQWRSNHTKRRVIAVIVACFNWASEDAGLVEICPYRKPKSLRLPVTPRREATREEYRTLMAKGSRALRRALYFLHRSGCRPCEMREAKRTDVNWQDGMVGLFRHKTARVTGECRVIALDPGVIRFLRNLVRQAPAGQEHLFVNQQGNPWDRHTFARNLRRVAFKAGLDNGAEKRVSAYCLRHTFTGEMVDLGFADRQIADQLGHIDTRMVSWYSKNRHKVKSMRRVADEIRRRRRDG